MPTLAFEHVNLRFNPFGELDPELRAAVAVLPPLELSAGHVIQVMGEAGRGKTTHLLAWHHAAPGSGYEYVPEGQDRLRCLDLPAFFFVDKPSGCAPSIVTVFSTRSKGWSWAPMKT